MRSLLALPMLAIAATASAQTGDFDWSKSVAPGTLVAIHNVTGDVRVEPGSGSRVQVTAVRRGRGRNADDLYVAVKEFPKRVVVCVLTRGTDESCDEDGAHMRSNRSSRGSDARMDVTVHLPASMRVSAHSVSGDVAVTGAEGDVTATSVSGDVRMDDLDASSVHAESVSGNVHVTIRALTGDGDLMFKSVSGDVAVTVPRTLDAEFSMSSVSGNLETDFPITIRGRMERRDVHARIGKGGRRLEVSTVSGDVRLNAAN